MMYNVKYKGITSIALAMVVNPLTFHTILPETIHTFRTSEPPNQWHFFLFW
jgi:hypothetical protein